VESATARSRELKRLTPWLWFARMTIEQIVEETRQWPEDTVAELIDRITIAKHGGLSAEREAAWAEVAARRSAELDSGKEKLIPGHEVSARIRSIVGR
jgi:hypothetical protein